MTLETFPLVGLVVFGGYVVFGMTGFGASPLTIPLLAHLLPITYVLGLCTLLDFVSGLAMGFHTRRVADRRELLALIPFTLLGVVLGVTLLVRLPREASLVALGVFVCAYAVYAVIRPDTVRPIARWWAAPAGLVGGIVGALFGVGGPPYVVYLSGRVHDKDAQRATITSMVIVSVGLRLVVFVVAGLLLDGTLWLTSLALLPLVGLGLATGNHLHGRASPVVMTQVVSGLLLVIGASLIYRSL